jgi:hypothetical protein
MHAYDGTLENRRSPTATDGGAPKVSVYLEQELLFQEQLKDVMEQRKLQQAKLELYDK